MLAGGGPVRYVGATVRQRRAAAPTGSAASHRSNPRGPAIRRQPADLIQAASKAWKGFVAKRLDNAYERGQRSGGLSQDARQPVRGVRDRRLTLSAAGTSMSRSSGIGKLIRPEVLCPKLSQETSLNNKLGSRQLLLTF
jgi:hypothetical protein